MLDEFIMKQLEENDSRLEKLNSRLKTLFREEESCFHMIKTLQEKEDVGREFFSPRGSDDTTRKKVAEIKKQIEEIQLEQIQVGEQIEQAKKEEEKYQNMLVEARSKNAGSSDRFEKPENPGSSFQEELKEPGIGAEQENEQKKELKIILERVEKCISLLGVDKGKCKHEMTNLKYYLKALISKNS